MSRLEQITKDNISDLTSKLRIRSSEQLGIACSLHPERIRLLENETAYLPLGALLTTGNEAYTIAKDKDGIFLANINIEELEAIRFSIHQSIRDLSITRTDINEPKTLKNEFGEILITPCSNGIQVTNISQKLCTVKYFERRDGSFQLGYQQAPKERGLLFSLARLELEKNGFVFTERGSIEFPGALKTVSGKSNWELLNVGSVFAVGQHVFIVMKHKNIKQLVCFSQVSSNEIKIRKCKLREGRFYLEDLKFDSSFLGKLRGFNLTGSYQHEKIELPISISDFDDNKVKVELNDEKTEVSLYKYKNYLSDLKCPDSLVRSYNVGLEERKRQVVSAAAEIDSQPHAIAAVLSPETKLLIQKVISSVSSQTSVLLGINKDGTDDGLLSWFKPQKSTCKVYFFDFNRKQQNPWIRDTILSLQAINQNFIFSTELMPPLLGVHTAMQIPVISSSFEFAPGDVIFDGYNLYVGTRTTNKGKYSWGPEQQVAKNLSRIYGASDQVYVVDNPFNSHLDLWIKPIMKASGERILIVGDPALGLSILENVSKARQRRFFESYQNLKYDQFLEPKSLQDINLDTTRFLTEKYTSAVETSIDQFNVYGFDVRRVPMVMGVEYGHEIGGRKSVKFAAAMTCYTNSIDLEKTILPFSGLAELDEYAKAVYENLGFVLAGVPLDVLINYGGAARCATVSFTGDEKVRLDLDRMIQNGLESNSLWQYHSSDISVARVD